MTQEVKVLLVLMSLLALSGCESKEDAKARIERTLPEGCTLIDLGSYGSISQLVAIRCPDAVVTHGYIPQWCGKVQCPKTFAIHSPLIRPMEPSDG